MPIPSLCRTISSELSNNLRLAGSEQERSELAAETLEHMGDSLFPLLNRLKAETSEGDDEYRRAQAAVLDLLGMAGVTFLRGCARHGSGVMLLEELAGKCDDLQVKKKLAIYANQLTQKWNQAEPGSAPQAPRARRREKSTGASGGGRGVAAVVATVALALLLMLRFTPGEVQHPGSKLSPAEAPEASPRKAPSEQGPASAGPVPGSATGAKPDDFVRYTDDSGVVHLGNDQGRVPERYRSAVEVVAPGGRAEGGVTQVVCNGNLVLVPVTLKYRGREVQTVLLLDTGASNTTINENVAARLGLRQNDLRPSTSTVADGRKLQSSLFTAEAISVGGQTLPAAEVSLLPGSGGRGTEGLLGMNFLKEFRYHVDFKRSVIEWGH